jgi:hypothetical protein
MSASGGASYTFGDVLPIEPIDPGTTVLVSGEGFSRADDVAQRMVADGTERDEGALFVSTNVTAGKLVEDCRRTHPALEVGRMGIVDCTGQGMPGDQGGAAIRYVSTQSDLTGIGMRFSALYESMYESAVEGRVRVGLFSLSSLAMYVELRKLFRFAQTISSRIGTAGGLGVFTIDPATHDGKTRSTLEQVADGKIEVEDADGDAGTDGRLRVRGLPDQPDGWQSFDLP